MKKEKKKKTGSIILIILIFIAVCFVIVNLYIYKTLEKKRVNVYFRCAEYIQLLYGYTECIDYAEKSGIVIDEAVKDEIKTFVSGINDLFNEYGYRRTDIFQLSMIGYMFSYYGLESEGLMECFDEHYIEDEKLFNSYAYQEGDTKGVSYIDDSITVYEVLGDTLIQKYNIEQGLIKWFNDNIEKAVSNNEPLVNFYTLLSVFYSQPVGVDDLNYQYLEPDALPYLEEYSKVTYDENITNAEIGLLDEAAFLADVYSYETDFLDRSRKLYAELSSFEAFNYYLDDETCVYILSAYLKDHYIMTGSIYNDFLAENFSGMIEEHYNEYCKGKLESIYEEIENK